MMTGLAYIPSLGRSLEPFHSPPKDDNKTTDLAVAAEKERLAESLHKQAFALAEESLKLRQKYDPGLKFTYDVIDGQLERRAVSQAPKRNHAS